MKNHNNNRDRIFCRWFKMDEPKVSPGKFKTLPEEIQANIIRQSVGIVSKKQQQHLDIKERIEDAGTKPFTRKEVELLFKTDKNQNVLVFLGHGDTAHIYIYYKSIFNPGEIIGKSTVNIIEYPNERIAIHTEKEETPEPESIIIGWLTNRIDSGIVEPVKKTVVYGSASRAVPAGQLCSYGKGRSRGEKWTVPNYSATIVLTDLISVFIILKERFELVFPKGATELAQKWTLEVLNNIVDDHQATKLPALLGYLYCNVVLFGKKISVKKYITEPTMMDDDYLKYIENECTLLYVTLLEAISELS